jgi:hypothetical protein
MVIYESEFDTYSRIAYRTRDRSTGSLPDMIDPFKFAYLRLGVQLDPKATVERVLDSKGCPRRQQLQNRQDQIASYIRGGHTMDTVSAPFNGFRPD